ncbi:MAG: lipid-A-disaccharide synthase [Pseudomonadota bacterium]
MKVFFVVGEESGDLLGAELIEALRRLAPDVSIAGSGGPRMAAQGLQPLFPLSDIAVMGFTAVVARLPTLVRRINNCVEAVLASEPDVLVIIDSPDFTHRVASRIRSQAPTIPIVAYVSPSVWVWRSGRARKMAGFVDHLLAILPFEPEVHRRLNGPPCTYVGHPLLTQLDRLRPNEGERRGLETIDRPVLLVLPGSRRSEISRLMKPFADTLERVVPEFPTLDLVLPAVDHLEADIRAMVRDWPVQPEIVSGEAAKLDAFRRAHAALAASGTVTLELALSGVPMVVAYKVDIVYASLRKLSGVTPVISLPNIILDEEVVPELIEEKAEPDIMAEALAPLLTDSPERSRQIGAFRRLDDLMRLEDESRPADKAAGVVFECAQKGRRSSEPVR